MSENNTLLLLTRHGWLTRLHPDLIKHLLLMRNVEVNVECCQTFNNRGDIHSFNDQPALIYADGSKEWYKDGQLHRDNDQPAAIEADGLKAWYKDGQSHRDGDQPAVIRSDGSGKRWYKNGVRYMPAPEGKGVLFT